MLLAYDNDVIPIPKYLRRTFQDDVKTSRVPGNTTDSQGKPGAEASFAASSPTPEKQLIDETAINPSVTSPDLPLSPNSQQDLNSNTSFNASSTNTNSSGKGSPAFSNEEDAATRFTPEMVDDTIVVPGYELEDLRPLTCKLNTDDTSLGLHNYHAFNRYFYKDQRDFLGSTSGKTIYVPQKKLFKENPLSDDPLQKNPLGSVAKSLLPSQPQPKVKDGMLATHLASFISFPETILEDGGNRLRWGESSCWDFALKKPTSTHSTLTVVPSQVPSQVLSQTLLSSQTKTPSQIQLPSQTLLPIASQSQLSSQTQILSHTQVPKTKEPDFKWITHGEFSIEAATNKLTEFFQRKWQRGPEWRVHIELLTKKYKPGNVTAYVFETCWSVPTRKKPVPDATGSIFVIMDVCSSKKPEAPVIVSCHYENSPIIFDLLKIKFGAGILIDIMERKRVLADRLIY